MFHIFAAQYDLLMVSFV